MGFEVAVGFWLGEGFVAVERGEEGVWVSWLVGGKRGGE
jgi:hypothetical protein